MTRYELRCRECGKTWGNQPRSICDDCFSPLEVTYDYDAVRAHLTRERIAQRPPNMWRYAELLPLPENYHPSLPVGFTPLVSAPNLGKQLGAKRLCIKNDAVCLPTLSFKDRVVAVALANARSFGFDTVACSSTGNLANSVAAQAAREGFKAWIATRSGFTPLVSAPNLGKQLGAKRLCIKNDAVCLPTLSFKDRVVAVALANARSFGFDTVACSSTGNLANSVAAQAAREGFKAWIAT